MQESNESPEQLPEPSQDSYAAEIDKAMKEGDYEFMLDTAKKSQKMLLDFRDAIWAARHTGKESTAIAMGLNFLDRMIQQGSGQIDSLKRAEKETRAAVKAALKAKATDPETPAPPAPPAPQAPAEVPDSPPAAEPPGDVPVAAFEKEPTNG